MNEFLLVAGVHWLAVMSPGPDFIMMLSNSLAYSRRTALYSAIGLGFGIALHVTYCLVGLAFIISQSILLFNTIKYLGAAYLIYLGIQSLRSKKVHKMEKIDVEQQKDISKIAAIRIGFLTNALNPKATVFFLALFTQVIDPATSLLIKMAYGIEMVLATILWFSLVAVFMTHSPIRRRFMGIKHHIEHFFGAILIGLGFKVALSTNR